MQEIIEIASELSKRINPTVGKVTLTSQRGADLCAHIGDIKKNETTLLDNVIVIDKHFERIWLDGEFLNFRISYDSLIHACKSKLDKFVEISVEAKNKTISKADSVIYVLERIRMFRQVGAFFASENLEQRAEVRKIMYMSLCLCFWQGKSRTTRLKKLAGRVVELLDSGSIEKLAKILDIKLAIDLADIAIVECAEYLEGDQDCFQ